MPGVDDGGGGHSAVDGDGGGGGGAGWQGLSQEAHIVQEVPSRTAALDAITGGGEAAAASSRSSGIKARGNGRIAIEPFPLAVAERGIEGE